MQCLALQLLTDPRRQNQTHPLQQWELHPYSKSARRSLRQRCFLGAAHAGPSALPPRALTAGNEKALKACRSVLAPRAQ